MNKVMEILLSKYYPEEYQQILNEEAQRIKETKEREEFITELMKEYEAKKEQVKKEQDKKERLSISETLERLNRSEEKSIRKSLILKSNKTL